LQALLEYYKQVYVNPPIYIYENGLSLSVSVSVSVSLSMTLPSNLDFVQAVANFSTRT